MRDRGIFYFDIFKKYRHLLHAASTRDFGTMIQNKAFYEENISRFLHTVGIKRKQLVTGKQRATGNIVIVSDTKKQIYDNTDGIITREKNIFLGIFSADCFPVLLYDPNEQIAGIAHAGYQGILV